MKWTLKNSTAKNAKSACVIKLERNNLTGSFMDLNKLSNTEFTYSPNNIGIYRILNNIDKSKNSVKGCQLVYKLDDETFYRRLSIPDDEVRELSNEEIQDSDFINKLAESKRSQYSN